MSAAEPEPRDEQDGEIVVDAIVDAGVLERYLDAIHAIADEAKVHFSDDGLKSTLVDPANVAMTEVALAPRAFEAYDAGTVTMGVNVEALLNRLDVAGAGDLARLRIDMQSRLCKLTIDNIDQSIRLIDPDSIRKEPDMPDLAEQWSTDVTLGARDISVAVSVVDKIADHIIVESDPEADQPFRFVGEGDVDDAVVRFGHDELVDGEVDAVSSSLLGLEYLANIIDPIPSDAEVRLQHGEDHPVRFDWDDQDGALDVGVIIAPRIQSEG